MTIPWLDSRDNGHDFEIFKIMIGSTLRGNYTSKKYTQISLPDIHEYSRLTNKTPSVLNSHSFPV